jgi:hypothetical protein
METMAKTSISLEKALFQLRTRRTGMMTGNYTLMFVYSHLQLCIRFAFALILPWYCFGIALCRLAITYSLISTPYQTYGYDDRCVIRVFICCCSTFLLFFCTYFLFCSSISTPYQTYGYDNRSANLRIALLVFALTCAFILL